MRDIGCVLSVEGLLQGVKFVLFCNQEMEECNDSAFEFCSLLGPNCDWREGLPKDDFTNVGGNEERNTTTKTVSFLEKFVKQDDDNSRHG